MEPLTIASLCGAFDQGLEPDALLAELRSQADATADRNVWIRRLTEAELAPYLDGLATRDIAQAPLWGVPFAIKDNIDLACVPTTAGCPGYAYTPDRSATVVERLVAAGAIPVGKTNMDQFATGLVGSVHPTARRTTPFTTSTSRAAAAAVRRWR